MINQHYLDRKRANISILATFILVIAVLSGCASSPPQQSVPSDEGYQASQQFNYKHKRAYNRPYRIKGKVYYPLTSPSGYSETGIASWYGPESGSKTSMGTRFWPEGVSAAHKILPLPSRVRVTNLHNGRTIVLIVNDRGPFKDNRIIDLSHGAARKIGLRGLAKVKVDYLGGVD